MNKKEDIVKYYIYATTGLFLFTTIIYKASQAISNQAINDVWRIDFEKNYKY